MAKSSNQKLKTILLLHLLETQTDGERGLTMPQIIERLAEEGVSAERKSVYRDLDALRQCGYDIQKLPTRPVQYALVRNALGFDDVMVLIDAVQSSRFLTERKSNHLVRSLKDLLSERQRKSLEKRVHVHGRIKSQSESVFHSVDLIHEALASHRKVDFLYFSYGTDLERHARHQGKRYTVTPVKVVFADGNYYLAAYDDTEERIKTYRIDRMELLQLSHEPATRNTEIANYGFEDFAYQSFGMFHGTDATVTLRVKISLMDAMVDRFGRALDVVRATADYADIRVAVKVSSQFFGWIAGLDGGVTIRSPKRITTDYHQWLKSRAEDE